MVCGINGPRVSRPTGAACGPSYLRWGCWVQRESVGIEGKSEEDWSNVEFVHQEVSPWLLGHQTAVEAEQVGFAAIGGHG